jgi:ubiquinone/menaquinone biosynthesis C-methylase UbiE
MAEERYFDQYANSYDKNLQESLKFLDVDTSYFTEYKIKKVKSFYQNKNLIPKKILDFGCGIGNSSLFLSRYFPESHIFGLDVSEKSIEVAQNRKIPNCDFRVYDGEKIPFEESSFDVVFISNVFHHINHEQHEKILHQLRELLVNEGNLFFFEHNTLNPLTLKIVRECEFDKDAKLLNFLYTRNLFKKAGFFKSEIQFILFVPPSFRKLLFLEKYLTWFPLGAQYYVKGTK